MSQRLMLLVAAALGAFLLVLTGGIGTYLFAGPVAAPTPVGVVAPLPPPGLDSAAVQALFAEREAAYSRQIAAANAQLQQAYHVAPAATPEPPAPPTSTATPAGPPAPAVTSDQAARIGRAVARGAHLLRGPELVDFTGTRAYELTFDHGRVYIDATTGQVLYNDAAQATVQAAPVPAGSPAGEETERAGGDD